jgi:hypothetical protein
MGVLSQCDALESACVLTGSEPPEVPRLAHPRDPHSPYYFTPASLITCNFIA